MEKQLILGIDPGTNVMGFALLEFYLRKINVIDIGVVKMEKLQGHYEKLHKIFEETTVLIEHYKPSVLAIEAPFYGKNLQSMLKLGRAQGVVIASCLHQGMEIFEYSPKKIKQSITGRGNASKEQVAAMLSQICNFATQRYFDATDALAVAYCHYLQNKITVDREKFSDWKNFLAKNQDRIMK